MHAALSVILFTVLSGMGLGAFAIVAADELARTFSARADALAPWNVAGAIALALVIAGLCFSTLHLANPKNAWRSAARFRTSWLSREAVFAVAFLATAAAFLGARWMGVAAGARVVLAVLTVGLAWVVIVCTAMIYASLKPIRAWHTWRVPLNYLLLAHASGAVLIVAILDGTAIAMQPLRMLAAGLLLVAALAKWEYRRYLAGDQRRVTLESALGVAHGVRGAGAPATVAARLLDVGHSRGTFLTREFVVTPTPVRQQAAVIAMWLGVYVLQLLWLWQGTRNPIAAALAIVVLLSGLLAERWLFFVEARHTVRLYHGERRV